MQDKKTYNEILKMLKDQQHQAPDQWDQIAEELSFANVISELKTHSPEKDLWTGIAEELDKEKPVIKTKTRRLYTLMKYAAVFALVGSIGLFIQQNLSKGGVVYSSEIELLETPTLESDDDSFNEARGFIADNSFLFTEEKMTEFTSQLEELEAAVEEIKLMQEQYGIDDESIKLLSKMEREKAELLKSMINEA